MLVVYDNDNDGFTAFWAIKQEFPNAIGLCVSDRQKMPHEVWLAKKVVIVDLAFTEEQCDALACVVELVVIDHHTTSRWLEDKSYGVWSDTSAACLLAWYWCTDAKPPHVVSYVNDRDIWAWKLEDSKEVNAFLSLRDKDIDTWGLLDLDEAVRVGKYLVQKEDRVVARQCVSAWDTVFDGVGMKAVCCTSAISETLHVLCGVDGVAIGFRRVGECTWEYSLRSGAEGPDVSAIAKRHGGGGHFHAAGFSCGELLL